MRPGREVGTLSCGLCTVQLPPRDKETEMQLPGRDSHIAEMRGLSSRDRSPAPGLTFPSQSSVGVQGIPTRVDQWGLG